MPYVMQLVSDGDLPEETPWVAAETRDRLYLFVKTSACPSGVVPRDALEQLRRLVRRRASLLELQKITRRREGLPHAI